MSQEEFEPFVVRTCEARVGQSLRAHKLTPNKGLFSPFEIYDPFGLRNAIVPVFRQDLDGRMYGMGTAFHIDGFGTFLTAHHVVDFVELDGGGRPILFLGMHAVVYGTVVVPPDCFVPAAGVFASMADVDDPLAALAGTTVRQPAIDVASLVASETGSGVRPPQTLPVRMHGWVPQIGEIVLAVGFPELNLSEVDVAKQSALLSEGMCGAYGRIVDIHPNGRSRSNRTPVFEVESDWPGGMSGGPVFNRSGEVVGLVSRSLRAEPGLAGAGFAVDVRLSRDVERIAPTLDPDNPGWRRCWGVFTAAAGDPVSFHASSEAAERAALEIGLAPVVLPVSQRIATDEYAGVSGHMGDSKPLELWSAGFRRFGSVLRKVRSWLASLWRS